MDNYIFFCSHNKKDGTEIFSQWYPSEFEEDGQKYHNCEQYMMAGKAKLCNDLESLDKILQISDPRKMKNLGRQIKNFNQELWDKHKFDIVKQGNLLKFTHIKQLKDALLKTNNKVIVEAAFYDKIWCIGLNETDAIKTPVNQWPGENLLGKAIMCARQEITDI